MKLLNTIYQSLEQFTNFVDVHQIPKDKHIFIQMFTGIVEESYIKDTIADIKTVLPNSTLVGATTGGEIIDGKVTDLKTVISISIFEDVKIDAKIIKESDSFDAGVQIANSIVHQNSKALILFSDGFFTLPNKLFDGIRTVSPNILIAGGMAGDNGLLKNTLVFLNDEISNNAITAISLSSDDLVATNFHKLNWRPVGQKMKITKAEGNIVNSVDGNDIKELYRIYLGDEIADGLPYTAALYPLVKEKDGFYVSRILFSFNEDGSANYTGNMIEGEEVRFAYANIDMILDNEYLENSVITEYESAYIYSCMSRKIILKDEIEVETQPIFDKIPMAGFFTYGEFYSLDNSTEVLNETMTMLLLKEGNSNSISRSNIHASKNIKETKSAVSSSNTIVKAITHLTDTVTKKIEEQNKDLREKSKLIHDSITYGSLIQHALLPEQKLLEDNFNDFFILWEPKDIVGGDIYLLEELRDKDEYLLMVIDCTGHGVSGAFVTMLVKAIERQIVSKIENDRSIDVSPAWILSYFNRTMKKLLQQEDKDSVSNAGFDGGIIYYNKKDKILKFAGAETPLFYVEDDELKIIKGNRYSVGYKKCDIDYEYKEHTIDVKEGMKFYLTTDGYLDQNGGEKSFPFGKKKFINIIKEHFADTMTDQQEIFLSELAQYQGKEETNDDVTLIGFKL